MKLDYPQSTMLKTAKIGRKQWIWPLEMLVFVLLFLGVWMIQILLFPYLSRAFASQPSTAHLLRIVITGLLLLLISLVMTGFAEQRPLSSMGLLCRGAWREYLLGALIGALLISICVLLGLALGVLELTRVPFSLPLLLLYLLAFILQGAGEELFCRGYLMISLTRKNPIPAAILISALLFAYMHLGNHAIGPVSLLNIALFGFLMGIYMLKRGSIWGICAIHSLWNFMQGCVFGISVSGTGSGTSPLAATLRADLAWLNGGDFGLEGGLLTTAVLLLALFAVQYLPTPKASLK